MTYTNARHKAVIEDWPHGFSKRVTATFDVERTKRGERCSRVTTGKPKRTTYATACCIADGDDGKLYVIQFSALGGGFQIWPGTLKTCEYVGHDDSQFDELKQLFLNMEKCND